MIDKKQYNDIGVDKNNENKKGHKLLPEYYLVIYPGKQECFNVQNRLIDLTISHIYKTSIRLPLEQTK